MKFVKLFVLAIVFGAGSLAVNEVKATDFFGFRARSRLGVGRFVARQALRSARFKANVAANRLAFRRAAFRAKIQRQRLRKAAVLQLERQRLRIRRQRLNVNGSCVELFSGY